MKTTVEQLKELELDFDTLSNNEKYYLVRSVPYFQTEEFCKKLDFDGLDSNYKYSLIINVPYFQKEEYFNELNFDELSNAQKFKLKQILLNINSVK